MSELPRRMLGRTGLSVTTLGYGAMELRGAPSGPAVSDQSAEKVLNAVLDAGINFIDTSIDYGRSEEMMDVSSPIGAPSTFSPPNAVAFLARLRVLNTFTLLTT